MTDVRIEVWRDPSALADITVRDDFGAIVKSERLAQVMRDGVRDGAVVIAALSERTLLGYATMVPSMMLDGRWRGLRDVFELGALEVARGARRLGIAKRVLSHMSEAVPLRTSVVLARGVFHHWEYESAGLTPIGYRRILMRLLQSAGFGAVETDDPEVTEHPLNFLAVRYGEEAPSLAMYEVSRRLDAREISEFAQSA